MFVRRSTLRIHLPPAAKQKAVMRALSTRLNWIALAVISLSAKDKSQRDPVQACAKQAASRSSTWLQVARPTLRSKTNNSKK